MEEIVQIIKDAKIVEEIDMDAFMDALRKVNPEEITHMINNAGMLSVLMDALAKLREAKPSERSEKSERYAVTITEMEKVVAYFKTWVVDGS